MKTPTLAGRLINLRPVKRSDAPAVEVCANDAELAAFIPFMPYPFTAKDARRWINDAQRLTRRDLGCFFAIELPETGEFVGSMAIKNLNLTDLNGELEYWLGRDHRRQGYSSEALRLILEYAFGQLGLWRVYAVVLSANIGSVRLLEKHGIVREGTWRQASRFRGEWHDVYAYGMLRGEFKP